MMIEERPLVTFLLFSYMQEQYIREAVNGALSQTYSPLQIILSDDCSSDRTFQIIKDMASDYVGPHDLVVNREQVNLGLGGHINKMMRLAKGELIVVAAGDDISVPARTSEIANAWISDGKKSGSLYSNYLEIDSESKSRDRRLARLEYHDCLALLRHAIDPRWPGLYGCAHAWTPDVFSVFGDLPPSTIYEDKVISFRSALFGQITHIDLALVKYRVLPKSLSHDQNPHSFSSWQQLAVRNWNRRMDVLTTNLCDLEVAVSKGFITIELGKEIKKFINFQIEQCHLRKDYFEGNYLRRIVTITSSHVHMAFSERAKWLILGMFPWVVSLRSKAMRCVTLQSWRQ